MAAREAVAVDFLGIFGQRTSVEKQNSSSITKQLQEPVDTLVKTTPLVPAISSSYADKAADVVVVGAAAATMTTSTRPTVASTKPSKLDFQKAEERQRSISRLRQLGEQVSNLRVMQQQLPLTWNKPEIVAQGGSPSPNSEEDNMVKTKETLVRSPLWSSFLEHASTTTADPSTSPMGWFHKALQQNGKKVAAQTLSSYRGDEPQRDAAQPQQRDAQPLEPAGSEPPLSVLIPDTESELPEVAAAAVAVDGAGFGSPLPVHFREANTASGLESEAAMDNQSFHQMQHPMLMQCGNLQSAATLPRSAQVGGGAGVHQPTAQLTLFYAGLVHVYDDITLDKMQAIMLLASGSTTSSSCKDPSGNGVSAHPLSSPIPQSTPSSSVSPPPQATSTATAAPSSIHANILPRSIARSVHAVTELPQARKASLARFLEKRKDRVRVKAPYPLKKEGSCTPPRAKSPSPPCQSLSPFCKSPSPFRKSPSPFCKSPSPPCGRPQTWSPTSALLRRRAHYLQDVPSTNFKDPQYCTSSGSEPNSPLRTPPTPPRPSMAGDINIIARSFRGRDFGVQPDLMVRQSGRFLSHSPQDHQDEEAMGEDAQ
ncbi:unnamed protein product [Sphagnum jensenii]|uniref:Tify domain-containing protein n=1 Tax=Sphagnum jensenii TaxID=128206 RepID=A0ABP0WSL3_9BRYO